VDMDGVVAYGQVFEADFDGEVFLALLERGGSGIFAGAGLQWNYDGGDLFRFGEGWSDEEADTDGGEREAHGLLS
jgi:hypothetical protein